MKKYLMLAYFVIAAVNIIGIKSDIPYIEYAAKFMLMPTLLVLLTISWIGKKDKIYFLLVIALLFAWAGDIFLIFSNAGEEYFLYGLIAFLGAHMVYIAVYYFAQTYTGNTPNRLFIASRIIILAFAGGAFLNVVWHRLGEFRLYIALYAAVVILMAVFAILRRERTSANSFSFVYGGALMFIVSDGMIAVSRFLNSFAFQNELIMITYVLAQFFIVKGIIEHHFFIHQIEE